MKKLLQIVFVSLLVTAYPFAASASLEKATAYVDAIAKDALTILNSNTSKAKQSQKLKGLIKRHVDISWIGKFVMGKHWRTASKTQQQRYLKHYEDFIVSSYAKRFTEYQGEGYKLLKSRQDSNNKYTVKMSIDVDGKSTMVDYKLRKNSNHFKIYDLNVEGVSLITTQRSEFNSIIQSKGVDYLIEQLANKADKLMAAANPK